MLCNIRINDAALADILLLHVLLYGQQVLTKGPETESEVLL
jgi:hypothetical protein